MANAFRLPSPPPLPLPSPAVAEPDPPAGASQTAAEREEAGRVALIRRRSLGRAGTVRTGWRGLLDLAQPTPRKTLLGE